MLAKNDKICEQLHTILREAARQLMKILLGGHSTPTRMFDVMVTYLLTCLFFFHVSVVNGGWAIFMEFLERVSFRKHLAFVDTPCQVQVPQSVIPSAFKF